MCRKQVWRPASAEQRDALARVIDAKLSLDWARLRFRWALADATIAGVPQTVLAEWQ